MRKKPNLSFHFRPSVLQLYLYFRPQEFLIFAIIPSLFSHDFATCWFAGSNSPVQVVAHLVSNRLVIMLVISASLSRPSLAEGHRIVFITLLGTPDEIFNLNILLYHLQCRIYCMLVERFLELNGKLFLSSHSHIFMLSFSFFILFLPSSVFLSYL